jgi:glycosyltransferase involved in cell wall biosynthesis
VDRSELAIVIPAFNEEKSIGKVVIQVMQYGRALVVNDASSDATAIIAAKAGAEVVTHPLNQGYDGALSSGFRRARELGCKYVITVDADGQHNPTLIAEYIRHLEGASELVLGIRDRKQRISEHIFAAVTTLLYGIRDPLCGMKGYRMALYERLGHFDSFGSIGTELALYAVKNHHPFSQIEVPTFDREGAPRFARLIRANYLILRAMVLSFVKV